MMNACTSGGAYGSINAMTEPAKEGAKTQRGWAVKGANECSNETKRRVGSGREKAQKGGGWVEVGVFQPK